MIPDSVRDINKIHTLVTCKGWVYRVVPGTYDDDGEVAWFEATNSDRVVIRVDEIATLVESSK